MTDRFGYDAYFQVLVEGARRVTYGTPFDLDESIHRWGLTHEQFDTHFAAEGD